ncbi:MAG: sigma-70 family RNA polymerase sigma factor [Ignavibacteria bacterium]|nr:sigma-70 family RNA polymerase sigma factor [Ignavibacteria bacterium]
MAQQSVTLNVSVRRTDEDSKLIEESAGGSREAFRELFGKYVSRIHALCLRISADKDLAEDLTQEVFISAWEKLYSFRHECRFSTWLHRIAVNKYLMHLRSSGSGTSPDIMLNESNTPVERSNTADQRIDLENSISKLPQQARTVLVLHDIEGYKHHEISEMMGIETGTSKAHLHRARKLLREELSK